MLCLEVRTIKLRIESIWFQNLALTNGSQTKEMWTKNTVPIYFKVYLFNWTNPELTLAHTEKANFVENGPYTFRLESDNCRPTLILVEFTAQRMIIYL